MTDKQIKKIALGVRKGILGKRDSQAYCFAVSAALQGYLRFCGIETELTEGDVGDWNHFWLTFADGSVLDATADQFGLEPVYLGVKPDNYRLEIETRVVARRKPGKQGRIDADN